MLIKAVKEIFQSELRKYTLIVVLVASRIALSVNQNKYSQGKKFSKRPLNNDRCVPINGEAFNNFTEFLPDVLLLQQINVHQPLLVIVHNCTRKSN